MDFNIPQDKQDPNIITNTARIDAALPTIKYAFEGGAKPFVRCSHLGRPMDEMLDKSSMAPAAKVVDGKLGRHALLMKDMLSSKIKAARADPVPGKYHPASQFPLLH